MIEMIGKKRFFILAVCFLGAVFLGMLSYLVLGPMLNKKEMELQGLKSQTSQMLTDIEMIKEEVAGFEKQKALFEKLNKMGFLDDQNRLTARTRFDTLQRLSKVVSARYEIGAANITDDTVSEESGFVTMVSPIKINISALDDLDVYRFLYYLNYGYPGHVKIKEFTLEKKMDISPETLKLIGSNSLPEIVSATIDMDWTTLAKKESIPPEVLSKISSDQQQVPQ